jgi:hypothetical protein
MNFLSVLTKLVQIYAYNFFFFGFHTLMKRAVSRSYGRAPHTR